MQKLVHVLAIVSAAKVDLSSHSLAAVNSDEYDMGCIEDPYCLSEYDDPNLCSSVNQLFLTESDDYYNPICDRLDEG